MDLKMFGNGKMFRLGNEKAFWVGFMLIAGAIPASAQETVEIRYTRDGVSHTVEVDRNIEQLHLRQTRLTSITLPNGLANLEELDLSGNRFTSLILPEGLTNLEELDLYENELKSLTLPEGLTNLRVLNLSYNQLTNFTLPNDLTNLEDLDLYENELKSLTLPEGLTNLRVLNLSYNQLTNFTLPNDLTNLEDLDLSGNRFTSLTLPEGLTSLERLDLFGSKQLTSLTLPEGLKNLEDLKFSWNQQLTSLKLAQDTAERPAGIDTIRGLAYNLRIWCYNVPLKKVILPKRLDGKVSFFLMEDDVYDNLEFLFLEDLRSPRITRAGDALEITWRVGVLQTSAGVEGPWKDIRASSPLRIFPRPWLPAEFFRVRAE